MNPIYLPKNNLFTPKGSYSKLEAWCDLQQIADENGTINYSLNKLCKRWRWSNKTTVSRYLKALSLCHFLKVTMIPATPCYSVNYPYLCNGSEVSMIPLTNCKSDGLEVSVIPQENAVPMDAGKKVIPLNGLKSEVYEQGCNPLHVRAGASTLEIDRYKESISLLSIHQSESDGKIQQLEEVNFSDLDPEKIGFADLDKIYVPDGDRFFASDAARCLQHYYSSEKNRKDTMAISAVRLTDKQFAEALSAFLVSGMSRYFANKFSRFTLMQGKFQNWIKKHRPEPVPVSSIMFEQQLKLSIDQALKAEKPNKRAQELSKIDGAKLYSYVNYIQKKGIESKMLQYFGKLTEKEMVAIVWNFCKGKNPLAELKAAISTIEREKFYNRKYNRLYDCIKAAITWNKNQQIK